MKNNTLTALNGVRVGHASDTKITQGCTVVTFDRPLNVGYVTKGGQACTYNTSMLDLDKNGYLRHGLFIADGGHKGLETTAEICRALREKGIGWKTKKTTNPSISGGVIQSLFFDSNDFNLHLGYKAVRNLSCEAVKSGNVGVGLSATVGKFSWTERGECLAMKSGVGSARVDLGGGGMICVLTVVNALGNIIDSGGNILAGNRDDNTQLKFRTFEGMSHFLTGKFSNTTISIIGTNIKLWILQQDLTRIADTAFHGQVRAINPVGTSLDGDMVFAFSTQEIDMPYTPLGKEIGNENGEWWKLSVDILGQLAAKAVQESIYDACRQAETVKLSFAYKGVIPSMHDYQ